MSEHFGDRGAFLGKINRTLRKFIFRRFSGKNAVREWQKGTPISAEKMPDFDVFEQISTLRLNTEKIMKNLKKLRNMVPNATFRKNIPPPRK